MSTDGDLFIGVDLGTTGVKVGLFDAAGSAADVWSREFRMDAPQAGFAEFDANAYMDLAMAGIREVLEKSGVRSDSVKGIGLSSQAQTFTVLDEANRPVRPAISWIDTRAEKEAEELSINAVASGPKLLWLRRHEPHAMARARRLMLMPDYLIYRLTGEHVTDPVTAGSTGMYDHTSGQWAPELLEAVGLDADSVPAVRETGSVAGTLTKAAAGKLGLSTDAIVAVGTNDQCTGALGAGNAEPGIASIAMGTALAIFVTTKPREHLPDGLRCSHHPVPGLVGLMAFAKTSGIVIRWFREKLAPDLDYDGLFAEAAAVPVGAEGVSALPHFSGTGTPTYDASVRGAFSGLSLAHGRAHMFRALVESLTFTIRENLELLTNAAGELQPPRMIGGGAQSDVWLQMIADATGRAIERPAVREAACLGAAELAMAAAGQFASVAEASLSLYRMERRFEPDTTARDAWDEAFERYQKLYEALYGEG